MGRTRNLQWRPHHTRALVLERSSSMNAIRRDRRRRNGRCGRPRSDHRNELSPRAMLRNPGRSRTRLGSARATARPLDEVRHDEHVVHLVGDVALDAERLGAEGQPRRQRDDCRRRQHQSSIVGAGATDRRVNLSLVQEGLQSREVTHGWPALGVGRLRRARRRGSRAGRRLLAAPCLLHGGCVSSRRAGPVMPSWGDANDCQDVGALSHLGLFGCAGGHDAPASVGRSTTTASATTLPSVEPVASEGCRKSPLAAGLHELSVDVGDHDYPYRVHVPGLA